MNLARTLSQRIKRLRKAAGLSQQEVATRGDLSVSLVAKLEQGKKAAPRASTLLALARALDVTPGELLEDVTPPEDGEEAVDGEVKPSKKKKTACASCVVGRPAGSALSREKPGRVL
jgi:transcriptional regulator with XRE-family HTH domain